MRDLTATELLIYGCTGLILTSIVSGRLGRWAVLGFWVILAWAIMTFTNSARADVLLIVNGAPVGPIAPLPKAGIEYAKAQTQDYEAPQSPRGGLWQIGTV